MRLLLVILLLATVLSGMVVARGNDGRAPDPAGEERRLRQERLVRQGLPPASGLVLVMIDTLRADRLGGYGHSRCTSPFLDRLARRGVQLENCISTSPWTRPSMASVLTGTYSGRHRVFREKWDPLPTKTLQLSEILRANGFTTIGVNANPILSAWFGFDQGFDRYLDSGFLWGWMKGKVKPGPGGGTSPWDARAVNRQAEALVASLPDGPFFLQLVYLDIHVPRRPPSVYQRLFDGPRYLTLYDASILYVDLYLQRLQAALARAGRKNVWFVVFADHGEGLNRDNDLISNRGHGFDLYDSLTRVPVILHHSEADGRLRGRRLVGQVSSVDLAPTMLQLLGLPHDLPSFQGRSLVTDLLSGESGAEKPMFSETLWRGVSRCAVRLGGWRLILHERLKRGHAHPHIKPGGVELYRLVGNRQEGDPTGELSAARKQQVVRLRQLLEAWRAENRPGRPPEDAAEPDKRTREALEALGYLQ